MKERPQQRDGDGVLFKNEKKETEKHPDLTGSITINGVQCWLSAWKRESKGGKKYLSLAATPKEQRGAAHGFVTAVAKKKPEFDDDF